MTAATLPLTGKVLIPIANEDDAERTCEAVLAHLDPDRPPEVTVVHVIEKAGGAPDKAPLDARQEQAEEIFHIAEAYLTGEGYDADTRIAYGTDVVDALVDAAEDTGATAIAFVPRESGRLARLLTGDLSKRLVLESPVPVVSLPVPREEEE